MNENIELRGDSETQDKVFRSLILLKAQSLSLPQLRLIIFSEAPGVSIQ
jgi:hypothetical protein